MLKDRLHDMDKLGVAGFMTEWYVCAYTHIIMLAQYLKQLVILSICCVDIAGVPMTIRLSQGASLTTMELNLWSVCVCIII